ncbi:hypothetical protein PVK06_017495 [Gossypium arboreum]|uniref:Uncharacterized protein n=1 Tax=Gossypium arboreum TaxID=29729 RepID=A0ABR0Q3L3_GOSAR|nr:hypothetical protein PVK06_017495 [Gossypium arboreum]
MVILATVEQVQLADAIRALLTTNPWELFFGIIEPTYLELTIELCSKFHLQTIITNYDDPSTVQFRLGGLVRQLGILEFGAALGLYTKKFNEENDLHALNCHIHRSPLWCWNALVPGKATYNPTSHDYREAREHWRRQHSRRLLLMVHVAWALHRPCLFHRPRDSTPDGAASDGGHLHWPLHYPIGSTLLASQHRGPRIIPYPHRPDVSIRHLEHA